MLLDQFLIIWNNKFPYDKLYRKKYNIAFNSSQHRETNQIDVFFDIYENKMYNKYIESYKDEKMSLKVYNETGQFLKEHKLSDIQVSDLFDKIDITKFNKEDNIIEDGK